MGAASAKVKNENPDMRRNDQPELDMKTKARVDRVSFNGIKRTQSPVLNHVVSPMFEVENFEEVVRSTEQVINQFKKLGVFNKIAAEIQTSSGPDASPHGYEITFQVNEPKRLSAVVRTDVSNNEATIVVAGVLPNTFGNAETVRGEYSLGSNNTNNMGFTFSKPLLTQFSPTVAASIFRHDSDWPTSGYKLRDTGLLFDLEVLATNQMTHNVQYECDWRQLSTSTKFASFDVRENSGHKLKSALRHILLFDQRDTKIFPTSGSMIKTIFEYSGLGGNVNFLKGELAMQWNFPIFKDVVLQLGYNVGHMYNWDEKHTVADNFFLGGPLDVRGFDFRSMGPRKGDNFVGGSTYYAGSLHIFSPLPFRLGEGGLGDLFRTHLWINGGNCGNFTDGKENHFETIRIAAGVGIAFKLMDFARAEVNYCFPFRAFGRDVKVDGIQIGVGMNFL